MLHEVNSIVITGRVVKAPQMRRLPATTQVLVPACRVHHVAGRVRSVRKHSVARSLQGLAVHRQQQRSDQPRRRSSQLAHSMPQGTANWHIAVAAAAAAVAAAAEQEERAFWCTRICVVGGCEKHLLSCGCSQAAPMRPSGGAPSGRTRSRLSQRCQLGRPGTCFSQSTGAQKWQSRDVDLDACVLLLS